MRSIKYLITAVFFAVLSNISMYYAYTTGIVLSHADNPDYTEVFITEGCFYLFSLIAIVFFILGWVVKEKAPKSQIQAHEKEKNDVAK